MHLARRHALIMLTAAIAVQAVHPAAAQLDIMGQLSDIVQKSSAELALQINLAGRQRMLTQKMSKEALLVALGIAPEKNRENLKATIALFGRTLIGLKQGDKDLGLPPAPNADIARQLDVVMELWKAFRPLMERIATTGKADKATLEAIARKNLPLLKEMNKAVKMFERASGADTAELAVVINLAGRQRMLTQKMTKDYLLIALGIDVEKSRKDLRRTVALFDRTLKGLLDGDPEQELPPTKDPAIRAQLQKVLKLWQQFRPLLEQPPSPQNLKIIATANLPLLKEMDKAVKMYEESW